MNFRRIRFRLNLTAATFLVAAGAIVVAAVFAPFDLPLEAGTREVQHAAPTSASTRAASRPSLASFAQFDLRPALTESPTTGPSAALAAAPGAPDVRLTGTIVEPGRAYAVFVTPAGQTQVRCVGQKAGGADVTRIEDNVVTLELGGKTYVLHVEKRAEATGL